jgi:hypothetical protein
MTNEQFMRLALSFPGTEPSPHFNKIAFRPAGKRIFATLQEEAETVNLKLSPVEQAVYCQINKEAIYPVQNKWGLHGWTTFILGYIDLPLMLDALNAAYKLALAARK